MDSKFIVIILLIIFAGCLLYYKFVLEPFRKLKAVRNQIEAEVSILTENLFYIMNSVILGINLTLVYFVIVEELSIMFVAASNAIFIFIFNIIFKLAFNEKLSYQSLTLKVKNRIFTWRLKKRKFDVVEYKRLEKLVF